MATIFRPLPRHQTVLNLFQQSNSQQPQEQEQHTSRNADSLTAAGLSAEQYDDSMDESFGHSVTSQDQVPDHIEGDDVSFATSISLNSPASPPTFQQLESSPYGMDICSPSPGHPLFGPRGKINLMRNHSLNVPQSFGKELAKEPDFLLPPRPGLPGSLLSRLTAGEKPSPVATGSVRSVSSVGSGKVGSIKSAANSKDTSAGKSRAPSRSALPSTWMNPPSGLGFPTSGLTDSSFGSVPSVNLHSPPNDDSEEAGDVSMEDAMDVDSPLHARRPPKAELRPRPLSLFIPPSSSFDITSQSDASASPVPRSTLGGYPSQDAFGAHFYDTPEVARTATLSNLGADEFGFRLHNPFGSAVEAPSSPIASPSVDRNRRCLSAVIPTSFSLASAASIDSGLDFSSQRGPLTAHPLKAERQASRIPKYTANRPTLSTVVNPNKDSPVEVHSANAVPSARMASLNPRRAFSAFIKPDQLGSAPYPGARGTRMNNGLPKGRVVSMLETVGGGDDTDDTFSGGESAFDSPSAARAFGAQRRIRSKGLLKEVTTQKYGSIKSRLPTHASSSNLSLHSRAGSNCSNPTPLKPLLPFGDGEHSGKILPCHSVKDDGLMRITPSAMRDLLSGVYSAQISSYQIIDCRFDYEFKGGHIAGAINLNKDEEIERYLFADVEQRGQLPPPSQSGDAITRKHVLIFHCEFSAKRGPTFAKHFRAKDRIKNQVEYPKLHYPELYILEGGYCSFYSAHPELCEPRGYVRMDAPQHSQARAADLGQFRRWNRTRSYTYGDHNPPPAQNGLVIRPSQSAGNNQPQRNTMPPTNGRMLSALGSNSRPQSFHELHTLEEDHATPEAEQQEEEQQEDEDQEDDDAASIVTATLTDGEIEAQYEAFAQDEQVLDEDDLEASLGLSESPIETIGSQPPETQEEAEGNGQAEEEEEDDDVLGHVDSSPCVIAEIKKGKRAGRPFFGRAFKPLSFGKPLSLSLLPPNRARGMERTASSIV